MDLCVGAAIRDVVYWYTAPTPSVKANVKLPIYILICVWSSGRAEAYRPPGARPLKNALDPASLPSALYSEFHVLAFL